MAAKVDFVRAQNSLELAFVVLHILFARKFANLIDSLCVLCVQTHVLATREGNRLNRVSQFTLDFCDHLSDLRVRTCTINNSGSLVIEVVFLVLLLSTQFGLFLLFFLRVAG